jgi:hypothetical protein
VVVVVVAAAAAAVVCFVHNRYLATFGKAPSRWRLVPFVF